MTDTPRFGLSRWVFLSLMGCSYLVAFASLLPQILGLIGQDGVLPVAEYLARADEFYGGRAVRLLPTLLWMSASDAALRALCWGGIALSILAIAGVAPVATFAALWLLYLSVTVGGQAFLAFQWDVLLLEAGLVAFLYAPLGWRPRRTDPEQPVVAVRWLLWSLAFKLTFLSGITKIVSGDPTWRDLTALTYHYQTQPLPAWTSWFVHQLPPLVHMTSAILMFAIELVVPFLILAPPTFRRTRFVAVVLLSALQLVIGLTGNYGFFNALTVVLYLGLLDDDHFWFLRASGLADSGSLTATPPVRHPRIRAVWRGTTATMAAAVGLVSVLAAWQEATYTQPQPEWSTQVRAFVRPLRSINGYGLFRTMTTSRPEIVIEGTTDGSTWKEYAFRWKPGDLSRRPEFVQPHMPRLDWQMWFAALDPDDNGYWLTTLVDRLFEESPDVLRLLDTNPFPDGPPRSIRLALYDYAFTTPAERRESGRWWRREFRRYLTEPITRRPPGHADLRPDSYSHPSFTAGHRFLGPLG